MARPYRLQGEGFLYHITSRGDDRKKIFNSEQDNTKFLEYIKLAKNKFNFYLYAYCLLSNHYHLLLETKQGNLSRIMQYINTAYTVYYNKKKKRCGHLFQGRYKSILVEGDSYFKELTRYIHLNPVRAKITTFPEQYKWSSYNTYLKDKKDGLVDIREVKQLLDMNSKEYRSFVNDALESPVNPIQNVQAGFLLGGIDFIKKHLNEIAVQGAKKDFAYKKALLPQREPEDIIQKIGRKFNRTAEEVKSENKRPQTAKKMAIYLLRKQSSLTNKQIGEIFNMKFSAVSKAAIDFKRQIEKDKRLAKITALITSKVEV